jgi:hypothetical protein
VAVDKLCPVDCFQGLGDLEGPLQALPFQGGGKSLQAITEQFPGNVFLHDVGLSLLGETMAKGREEVGVGQQGGCVGVGFEGGALGRILHWFSE